MENWGPLLRQGFCCFVLKMSNASSEALCVQEAYIQLSVSGEGRRQERQNNKHTGTAAKSLTNLLIESQIRIPTIPDNLCMP